MLAVASFLLAAASMPAMAIPASERTVLVNLYNATGGPAWTNQTGWNDPNTGVNGATLGSECGWFGVNCSAGRVVGLALATNHLVGTLPALTDLPLLQMLGLGGNQLSGSIPALSGFTGLQFVAFDHNQFSGPIPSLAGLTGLQYAYFNSNGLTGGIPSLAGLTALKEFSVRDNQLTGPLPSLAGLTALTEFSARDNQLSGSLPPLAGLPGLVEFDASGNGLTGTIPPLAGLSALRYFNVGDNQLTGPVPSLAGLASLQSFYVYINQLSGPMAMPPSPSALLPVESNVCLNQLSSTGSAAADAAWDVASGLTPAFGSPGWLACQGLSFGDQVILTTSAPRGLTIGATSDSGPITFTTIAASGDFAQSHNCPMSPASLQIGASCTISVTFTPTALGPRTGELTLAGSTQSTGPKSGALPMRGNGVAAPVAAVAEIPTLSETGLLLLAGILLLLGVGRAYGRGAGR